jgi:hypothetical protein
MGQPCTPQAMLELKYKLSIMLAGINNARFLTLDTNRKTNGTQVHSMYLKILSITALLVVGCVLFVVVTRGHWWRKLSGADVIYNGQSLVNAKVYRSPNGELLVDLSEVSDEAALYVLYPAENKVGTPNYRHFVFLPGYAYSRYVSPIVVFMHSAKAETDPRLAVTAHSVEFSTLRDRRVQIRID